MATIPLPELSLQPPQAPDLLGQMGKVVALKSMLQQQQYQQQMQPLQLQEQQAQTTIAQRNLQSQQAMLDLAPQFVQKDDQGKPTGYDTSGFYNALLSSGKVDPNKIFEMRNQQAVMQKNLADAGTAQINLQDKKNGQAYQILESVRDIAQQQNSTPDAQQQAYMSAIPKLRELGIDTSQYPANFAQVGTQGLNQFEVSLGIHKQIIEDAKTTAQTAEASAKAALDQIKVKLSQNSKPGDFDTLINQAVQSLPEKTAPVVAQRYNSLINLALQRGDYEGAQTAVKQMYSEIGGFEKERFTQAQESVRQTLNRQAMQADRLQMTGLSGLDKLWTDPQHGFGTFLSQALMTKNAVADSKNGDELASSMVPVMTAQGIAGFAGIKRIPPAEVAAAGPKLGSIYRQLDAILEKAGSGSVPPDTLKEVDHLFDQMIDVRHAETMQSSSMLAKNTRLDPSNISVLDKKGQVVPMSSLQAPPPAGTGGAAAQGRTLPAALANQILEGHTAKMSDGTSWKKQGGQVSQVQGP